MRRVLSFFLSLAMVLSLCVGLFSVTSSADGDGDAPSYKTGQQYADEIWAKVKSGKTEAKEVTLWLSDSDNVVLQDGDSVTLKSECQKFTAGTASLVGGFLTLDGAKYSGTLQIRHKGAIQVVLKGGGSMQLEIFPDHNPYVKEQTAADDWSVLVSSPDGTTYKGTGGNAIRTQKNGAIVLYGNLKVNIKGSGSYDNIIVADSVNPLIFACDTVYCENSGLGTNKATGVIENRKGDIILTDSCHLTVKHAATAVTSEKKFANAIALGGNATNQKFEILGNADLTIEDACGTAIHNASAHADGSDAVVFDTTGSVNITANAFNAQNWSTTNALIYVNSGSIRVKNRTKITVDATSTGHTGASFNVFNLNNSELDPNVGLFFCENSETDVTVDVATNKADDRTNPIWVNAANVVFKDNSKFNLKMTRSDAKQSTYEFEAFHVKVGAVTVQDNAYVNLDGSGTSTKGRSFFTADVGDAAYITSTFDDWKGKTGLFVKGGILNVSIPDNTYGFNFNAFKENKTNSSSETINFASSLHLSGGIFLIRNHNTSQMSLIGNDLNAANGVTIDNELVSTNRFGADYLYLGKNAFALDAIANTRSESDKMLPEDSFNAFAFHGAQIRLSDPSGLRFVASVSEALLSLLAEVNATVSYGFVVAREDKIPSGSSLVLDSAKTGSLRNGGWKDVPADVIWNDDDSADWGYKTFTVAVTGLTGDALTQQLAARPYMKCKVEGESFCFYLDSDAMAPGAAMQEAGASVVGNAYAVSIAQVATVLKASTENEFYDQFIPAAN